MELPFRAGQKRFDDAANGGGFTTPHHKTASVHFPQRSGRELHGDPPSGPAQVDGHVGIRSEEIMDHFQGSGSGRFRIAHSRS
jgi:hypothetical protein